MTPEEKLAKLQVGAKVSFANIPDFVTEVVERNEDPGHEGMVAIFVAHGAQEPVFFLTGLEADTSLPNVMALDNFTIIE